MFIKHDDLKEFYTLCIYSNVTQQDINDLINIIYGGIYRADS